MKHAIAGMLTAAVLFSSCITPCLPVRAEDAPAAAEEVLQKETEQPEAAQDENAADTAAPAPDTTAPEEPAPAAAVPAEAAPSQDVSAENEAAPTVPEDTESAPDEAVPEEAALLEAAPASGEATALDSISVSLFGPGCGETIDPDPGDNNTYADVEEWEMASVSESYWVSSYSREDYTALEGTIEGGQEYTAYIVVQPEEGYRFAGGIRVEANGEALSAADLLRAEEDRIVCIVRVIAVHSYDESYDVEPTCIDGGILRYTCYGNAEHTYTEEVPPDPDAHVWGDWQVSKEPTTAEEGEKYHICTLCGEKETAVVPKVVHPYSEAYDPETSWAQSATIAWYADTDAVETAGRSRRPDTAFIWLDRDLKVYDRDGDLLSDSLDSYVDATRQTVIPAFYIQDEETAQALKAWISRSGLQDCFVVSTPENKELVREVADLLHVRGMLDCTSVKSADSKTLARMAADVNSAHGKIVLLSQEAAMRENIRKLQSLCGTVWVESEADTKTLLTHYTNGVNGIVVREYEPAIRWMEWFQDDAPSILRIPFVIGHRGDPSIYVENTLDSAEGAAAEGVDSVENDIQLSADGQLFIYHDDTGYRLMGLGFEDLKGYTLEELRQFPFVWGDEEGGILVYNEVPVSLSRYGYFVGQEEQKEYTVPTLKEYIETFLDQDIVHDTEIKSDDPAILQTYKELVDAYDAWDQFFSITFNIPILETIYSDHPEMSIGALGYATDGDSSIYPQFGALSEIAASKGTEAAVQQLYSVLDRWNATYNPDRSDYGQDAVRAGRHRGLTVWPWTYRDGASFASDYLFGVNGLTVDYAWWASDFIEEISSRDETVASLADVPKPQARTKLDTWQPLGDAELVKVEDLSEPGTFLMIWRRRTNMLIDGEDYGTYYLYSNPFVVRIVQKDKDDPDASGREDRRGAPVPRSTSPATGDSAHAALWLLCLLLAGWGVRRRWHHL